MRDIENNNTVECETLKMRKMTKKETRIRLQISRRTTIAYTWLADTQLNGSNQSQTSLRFAKLLISIPVES